MINDRASRLTARVAPFLDAVASARSAGLTWRDLAVVLGVASPNALRQAVRCCKYKADQLPLPEVQQDKPAVKVTAPVKVSGGGQVSDVESVINKNLIA